MAVSMLLDRRKFVDNGVENCPINAEMDQKNRERVFVPSIPKKYVNMRCNINNEVHKAFIGKCRYERFIVVFE